MCPLDREGVRVKRDRKCSNEARRGTCGVDRQDERKAVVTTTFLIMTDLTLFVYCFLKLNKQSYTLVGSLESGLSKAAMGTVELNVA